MAFFFFCRYLKKFSFSLKHKEVNVSKIRPSKKKSFLIEKIKALTNFFLPNWNESTANEHPIQPTNQPTNQENKSPIH